jgi:hypothetical protein
MDEVIGINQPSYTFDQKQFVQNTSRPLGTVAHFTSEGDSTSSPVALYGGEKMCVCHKIGDATIQKTYVNFNVKENPTYIHEGYVMWRDAQFDRISMWVEPVVTDYTSSTNTYFNLYGGYLIVPVAGNGTIELTGTPKLVKCPVSVDYGTKPPGYWNAPYDTVTHTFGDLTAAPNGDGLYNLFAQPVNLGKFVNEICVVGSGQLLMASQDSKELTCNTKVVIQCETDSTADHEWGAGFILSLFRETI